MSTEPTPGTTYEATLEHTKPRRWPWIVGIIAALFVGLVVGSIDDTEPAADVEPEPAVTVTAEPEVVTETVVETVTETVDVTPAVCLEALDEAANAFVEMADTLDVIVAWHDELTTILDRDGYLITAEWNELDAEYAPRIPEITSISGAAAECRLLAEG